MHPKIQILLSLGDFITQLADAHYPREIIWTIMRNLCETKIIEKGGIFLVIPKFFYGDDRDTIQKYSSETGSLYPTQIPNSRCIKTIKNAGDWTIGLTRHGKLYEYDSKTELFDKKIDICKIKKIKSGYGHFVALDFDGNSYSWGLNLQRQLGLPKQFYGSPQKMPVSNVRAISCGFRETAVILPDDKIYVWGDFATENFQSDSTEFVIPGVCKIKFAYNFMIFLTRNYELFGCGSNKFLGVSNVPNKIDLQDVISVGCGSSHIIALTKNGDIYGWGKFKSETSQSKKKLWQKIPQKISFTGIISVFSNSDFVFARTAYDEIYTWNKIYEANNETHSCLIPKRICGYF